ncbi:MAG: hypothetical protein ACRD19_00925, partial [Terriglobia bacterium]
WGYLSQMDNHLSFFLIDRLIVCTYYCFAIWLYTLNGYCLQLIDGRGADTMVYRQPLSKQNWCILLRCRRTALASNIRHQQQTQKRI